MRFVASPAGAGSGEQWVRERFAVEVEAFRGRRAHAGTALIVVIDADAISVQERLAQLDRKLDEAQADRIRPDAEQVARLVPKRNVETWILCLNEIVVDDALFSPDAESLPHTVDAPVPLVYSRAESSVTVEPMLPE